MDDIRGIFAVFSKLSTFVHLANERQRKLQQINSVQARRCGNCHHWMKSGCKPEKKLGQFKSSSSLACGDFVSCQSRLIAEFSQELSVIDGKIAQATDPAAPTAPAPAPR